MIVGVYRSLLAAGSAAGHPEMLFFSALLGSWAFLFVTAIPLALSVLYYSSDLRMLLTLPVSPFRIVGAKALLLYLYCLPVNLLLMVPALWLSAGASGFSPALVVSGLLSLVVYPVLPLSLATLLVLGLMKVVNLSRYRVALEVAGMAVGIVLVVGLQVVLSRSTISVFQGGGGQPLSGFTAVYAGLARALPPVAWAAVGFVAGAGPLPILGAVLVTAILLAAALLLAPLNFLHDVTERREPAVRAGRLLRADAASLACRVAPHGIVRRLVGREWSILSSNSTFIFEAIGELLVLPLLLGVYGLIIPRQYLGAAMTFITGMPGLGPALMGVLVLMTSLTTFSSTSISREGRLMGLSLAIPVSGRTQVKAKLCLHILFFSTAYLVDCAIMWVLFRFPLVALVFMVPGGIALQVAAFVPGMYFDLKRPILKWTHPQQAMKNNMNAMSGIGASTAVVAVVGAPGALLILKGVDPFLVGCGAALVGIALVAVLLPLLLRFADRQYSGGLEIE
jgi:ABC-2 type transport system permease protein